MSDDVVECQWFAGCTRPADGIVKHVALGYVPTCDQCAYNMELELIPCEFQLTELPFG